MSFDLKEMARQQGVRRRRVALRRIEPPRGVEAEYRRVMVRMLNEMAVYVRQEILPQVEQERSRLTQDEVAGNRVSGLFGGLRALYQRLLGSADGMVERIFQAQAQRHTDQWSEAIRSAIGIDMRSVLQASPGLEDRISLAVARNVELIRNLAEDTERRVAEAITRNLSQGGSARDLSRELTEQFGIEQRRANLIARNETANVNSLLNQYRQQEAGIEQYRWASSRDERTRPLHAELDGQVFKWSEPGPAENGAHPGEAINCRCTASPVIEFD